MAGVDSLDSMDSSTIQTIQTFHPCHHMTCGHVTCGHMTCGALNVSPRPHSCLPLVPDLTVNDLVITLAPLLIGSQPKTYQYPRYISQSCSQHLLSKGKCPTMPVQHHRHFAKEQTETSGQKDREQQHLSECILH